MDVEVNFRTDRNQVLSNGMSVCELNVPALDTRQFLFLPFDSFHRYYGAPEGVAGDLLAFAGCCYVVDQIVPRSVFPDNWTRELTVKMPVAEPERWNAASVDFEEAFTFLTGDRWQIAFTKRHCPIYRGRRRRLKRIRIRPASAICLFSGGLDSLVGAVDHVAAGTDRTILVGHFDLGSMFKQVQVYLADQLAAKYPNRFDLVQARVGPVPRRMSHPGIYGQVSEPKERERSLRSRSLVFLSLGLYFAQQQGATDPVPLLMPENGLIAVNPPLTDSRLGSCSTRTAHPWFLTRFQQAIQKVGIENPIQNPLAGKTKGEILAETTDRDLIQHLAPFTVSCAHPTRRQGWIRRSATHCGYCIPCLFRRAALHRIGMDDGKQYGLDVCGELALDESVASDLRALLSWVFSASSSNSFPESLVDRMPLPSHARPHATHVLKSGLSEVSRFFDDKGTASIRAFAGIA